MAMRKLIKILDGLMVGSDPSSVRQDNVTTPRFLNGTQLNLLGEGVVQEVGEIRAFVSVKGNTVPVFMATDEPFRAGQRVWVSRTIAGDYIAHGSIK